MSRGSGSGSSAACGPRARSRGSSRGSGTASPRISTSSDKVFLGVDRGSRDEQPAIVIAAKREDRIYVKAQIFPDGTDFEDLEDAIRA